MVVDSSIWIELFRAGPLKLSCEKALKNQEIRVPTIVLFEIYKKLKAKVAEDVALEAMSSLSQYQVLDLNREVAMLAGDLCLQHDMPMADGIVLAHALHLGDTLLTLDHDFSEIPGAKVIRS